MSKVKPHIPKSRQQRAKEVSTTVYEVPQAHYFFSGTFQAIGKDGRGLGAAVPWNRWYITEVGIRSMRDIQTVQDMQADKLREDFGSVVMDSQGRPVIGAAFVVIVTHFQQVRVTARKATDDEVEVMKAMDEAASQGLGEEGVRAARERVQGEQQRRRETIEAAIKENAATPVPANDPEAAVSEAEAE